MSSIPERLVIASRGSRLALKQAAIVSELVHAYHPDIAIEIKTVTTTGDKDSRPFGAIGGNGLFTSEVEREVADGRADVAVHSAKDLTAQLADGCGLVCIPERGPVHDVVVGSSGSSGEERLSSLPAGARVGTSSMRRRALLAESRSDVEAAELRGNLDTRLKKVTEGVVDAAILAAAGLVRLGDADPTTYGPLDPSWWTPPPGQGALAVEARTDRADLWELFQSLDNAAARSAVMCERAFAVRLEGGCSVPLGCLATSSEGRLVVTGYLGDPDGGQGLRDRISGSPSDAESLGRELAEAILAAGGDEIRAAIAAERAPEVPAP